MGLDDAFFRRPCSRPAQWHLVRDTMMFFLSHMEIHLFHCVPAGGGGMMFFLGHMEMDIFRCVATGAGSPTGSDVIMVMLCKVGAEQGDSWVTCIYIHIKQRWLQYDSKFRVRTLSSGKVIFSCLVCTCYPRLGWSRLYSPSPLPYTRIQIVF